MGPSRKFKIRLPIFSSPGPEVSEKVRHIHVGEKLRDEKDFQETGCFGPSVATWRLADLRPRPEITCVES